MASRWFTFALLLTPSLALKNNFDFYPKGAQACLDKNADDASCTGADAKELNYCLCGLGNYNNDFILGSARCIGQESPNDIDETYDMMNRACSDSNTPMKTTKKEFQQAAHDGETTTSTTGGTSSTASATDTASTASDTAASSTDDADADAETGLSTGATIGVAVGAAAGGAAMVGLVIWFWLHRRKKNAEESHPMLPNYESHNSPYPPTESKPAWATTPSQGWQTPDPNASGFYTPGVKHNAGPVELPPDNLVAAPAPIFEMDGTSSAAVEMPGSTPVDAHHRGSDEFSRRGLGSSAGDATMVSPQTQPGTPYRPHGDMGR